MTIKYIKKADKTAASDEVETRQRVQDILKEIESKRDEGIKNISRKFDQYEGDVIVSKEKIEEIIKSLDQKWIEDTFIPRVQKRGAEIIEHRGKSSAASAASAIYDHLYILVNGSKDWESMGVMRENTYGVSDEIFFSFPLQILDSNINIINGLDVSEISMKYIKDSEKELLIERDIIKDILKG